MTMDFAGGVAIAIVSPGPVADQRFVRQTASGIREIFFRFALSPTSSEDSRVIIIVEIFDATLIAVSARSSGKLSAPGRLSDLRLS